ncbi:Serine/threonine-protein kinase pkn1 [Pirellula sp. SH-Sr6A]|uniref:SUMF1/EgtB/PvdO family nonheme iron enzyme n=1 Tax=Pirellula sp. SH-Sr6A TaxID=1632865 RepID=UPI00078B7EA6|nr:SUMF1/EgtB/PvdO family nonheme iron enzyme [Pirellula sp. SH-Sr6A]AMV33726.1 Serine/threonine-protein kinase pkn1 [Pirellula sp. SH-Sr6A]
MKLFIRCTVTIALFLSSWAQAQEQKPTANAHQAFTKELENQLTRGRRLAIVIGIDAYQTRPLKCCVKDAKLLAATLRDRCGYDPDGILEMTDQQENPALRPTLVNLRREIRQFLSNATSKDTILISFSGHGGLWTEGTILNPKRIGFVCPIDFDGERAKETSLTIDDLRTMLQECLAAQKLLVLDSCHSGGGGITSGFTITENVDQTFQKAQGLITFAACRRDEVSSEDREVGHGAFTLSFVRGLEGQADFDQNRIVDSDELYRHVLAEVPAHVSALFPGRNQTPIRVIGHDVVGVFALAPVLAKPKITAALARLRPGEVVKNSLGMSLVLLPRSSYIKGSAKSEYKRHPNESLRAVIISKRLLMGTHEVTQSEFELVMGYNPSYHAPDGEGATEVGDLRTGRFPVEQVSWLNAFEFCKKLTERPEEVSAGRVYRLPTESEWEFACRAGSVSAFSTGQVIDGEQANIRCDQPYWYARRGEWMGRTQMVGRHAPNLFGLYDMHGNVTEWCYDNYREEPMGLNLSSIYDTDDDPGALLEKMHQLLTTPISTSFTVENKQRMWSDATDPTGPVSGNSKVIRGGSYLSDVGQCRSASRRAQSPGYTHKALGFRVVCEQSNISR